MQIKGALAGLINMSTMFALSLNAY